MKQVLITVDEKTGATELKALGLDSFQVLGLLEYFKNQVITNLGKASNEIKGDQPK